MKVGFAATWEVDGIWPKIVAGMQRACERGVDNWSAGELWQLCRSGRAFLCVVFDDATLEIHQASVWQFMEKDGRTIFRCLALWGVGMRGWVDGVRSFITKTAKDNGAKALVTKGRPGWLRFFHAEKVGDDYEVNIDGR